MKHVWIFADWKLPDEAETKLMEEIGFTDVVLGLVGAETTAVKTKYSTAKIRQAAASLKERGFRVHVMSWIRRNRKFIKDCAAWMIDICGEIDAASGLLDAESHWHSGSGISAVEAAASASSAFANLPCPLGVTGLSNLHSTVLPLLRVADYGLGQAYSIWTPGASDHWSHHKTTEPYEQQLTSWRSWRQADKPLIMGLSNYYAARPKRWGLPAMTAEESLSAALRGAVDAGATEVAYWSLKWLKGEGASRETARRIIQSIVQKPSTPTVPTSTGNPDVEAVQWLLVKRGLDLGDTGPERNGVDGKWGTKSRIALNEYRLSQGLNTRGDFVLEDVTSLVNNLRKSLPV